MTATFLSLTVGDIESSVDIQAWLSQFEGTNRGIAIDMLRQLMFISDGMFSKWLHGFFVVQPSTPCAIFSVRKKIESTDLWDTNGNIEPRPGTSLGSEDMVYSHIASISRKCRDYLDHPSWKVLKERKVSDFILIDDSIGSGARVSEFIRKMMMNKTMLSWWSFGWIRIKILAYSRILQAERSIIESIPGSDHWKRKFKKSEKIAYSVLSTHYSWQY